LAEALLSNPQRDFFEFRIHCFRLMSIEGALSPVWRASPESRISPPQVSWRHRQAHRPYLDGARVRGRAEAAAPGRTERSDRQISLHAAPQPRDPTAPIELDRRLATTPSGSRSPSESRHVLPDLARGHVAFLVPQRFPGDRTEVART
jgi:hypothetical protein